MKNTRFTAGRLTLLVLLALFLVLAACQNEEQLDQAVAILEATAQPAEVEEPTQEPTEVPPTPEPTPVPLTPTATAEPVAAYEPVFEPTDCWFDVPASQLVDCGYLVVPEDRSKPDGRSVRLATAIFRAPGGNPEPDPIIQLHGGPGGGVLTFFGFGEYGPYADLTATNRDVIVFDQRGNGISEPALNCPELANVMIDNLDLEVNGEQITHNEAQQLELEAGVACSQSLAETVDLSMFTTKEIVEDVNDMRIALGYDMVNLHGESYGTTVAQEVARKYPETIRSLVFDAVEGPNDGFEIWPGAASDALNQAFVDCAADEACNAAFPNLREVWLSILDRVDAEPVTITAEDMFTGEEYPVVVDKVTLGFWAWRITYSHTNYGSIPQIVYELNDGNYDVLKPVMSNGILIIKLMNWGVFYSINCNGQLPYSSQEQFIASAENHPDVGDFFLHGTMLASHVFTLCEQWESGVAPASSAEPFISDIPTLVLGSTNDPATPSTSPYEVMEDLSNGFGPYIFPGMGHVVSIDGVECPTGVAVAFLIDPTTAPDGSCIDEMTIDFVIPGEGGGEIVLEPFTNEEAGFSTVIPAGWQELLPGVYSRGNPAVDPTILGQLAAPTDNSEAFIGEVLANLGVAALPETPVRVMDSDTLSWSLYLVSGDPTTAVALAENETTTYMVALKAAADEFDALADGLLVPAIMAFMPNE